MGMGTIACHADIIENKQLEKLCPVEYKAFMDAIDGSEEADFDSVCRSLQYEEGVIEDCSEEESTLILDTFQHLVDAFSNKTLLSLGVVHHDQEDRYDELDGGAFTIADAYIPNPAVAKLSKQLNSKATVVERKYWTTFG